ncbi:hypothetical protein HOI83_02515, partial [Candidatus Uhrbacteria bacterium]|nr:hypothetical protein [Candidatus Uhrbacteria bacterium]
MSDKPDYWERRIQAVVKTARCGFRAETTVHVISLNAHGALGHLTSNGAQRMMIFANPKEIAATVPDQLTMKQRVLTGDDGDGEGLSVMMRDCQLFGREMSEANALCMMPWLTVIRSDADKEFTTFLFEPEKISLQMMGQTRLQAPSREEMVRAVRSRFVTAMKVFG